MADRCFPEQRPHEARFRPLTPAAKLCWYTLTGILGASGIAITYAATVAELTGLPAGEVDTALAELQEREWLRREGAVSIGLHSWPSPSFDVGPFASLPHDA